MANATGMVGIWMSVAFVAGGACPGICCGKCLKSQADEQQSDLYLVRHGYENPTFLLTSPALLLVLLTEK